MNELWKGVLDLNGADLRRIMGHFATGVAVVTTNNERGEPYGLTVNSLTSLSLNPPLILVCLDRSIGGVSLFVEGRFFSVNILTADQQSVSTLFAKKGIPNRFASINWAHGEHGAPILNDVLACLECRVESLFPGGDHIIIVGRVLTGNVHDERQKPLIFYKGAYETISEASTL